METDVFAVISLYASKTMEILNYANISRFQGRLSKLGSQDECFVSLQKKLNLPLLKSS